MTILNAFDKEIANLVNSNRLKEALDLSQQLMLRAALTKAGIYSERKGDIDEATRILEPILEICPGVEVGVNLSSLYMQKGRYDLAGKVLEKVMAKQEDTTCYFNYGLVCMRTSRNKEAIEAFRKAAALDPQCPVTQFQLACCLLSEGQFKEGLERFESRFRSHAQTISAWKRYKKPRWDGESDVKGARVLIGNEQGQGDAIMLARYVGRLRELGAVVIMEVQDSLIDLFAAAGIADEYVPFTVHDNDPRPSYGELPDYDLVVSMWSLMHHFDPELKQEFEPYLFAPQIQEIRSDNKRKIGICWAGSSTLPTDCLRSCHLKHFKPLAAENLLFSFQRGRMMRDWSVFEDRVVNLTEDADFPYDELMTDSGSFLDTASLLQEMDVVVTVDTALAHLAGAMGKRTMLLLSNEPDWRWQRSWYSSVEICRQSSPGDWSELLERVAAKIELPL